MCTVKVQYSLCQCALLKYSAGVDCMGGRGWFVGGGIKFLVAEIQIKQRWDFFFGFLGHFWEKIKGGVGGLNWV